VTLNIVILHGSNDLYGASRVLISEADVLQDLGHAVTVVTPVDGPLSEVLRRRNVRVVVDSTLAVLRASRLRDVLKMPRLPAAAATADVVVLWTLALAAYMPLLRLKRKRHWISVHELRPNRLAGLIIRMLVQPGRSPVEAVSQAVRDWLEANGVPRHRIVVAFPVAPKVEPQERKSDGAFVVAVAGRLNGRKGHLEVLRAFQRASQGAENWQLILAGSPFGGDRSAELAVEREAAGDARVQIVGEVAGAAAIRPVPSVYACFGDREESFGLVPLEAWSVGARSAAFAEGGAAEVVPVVNGVLVPRTADTVQAIAASLKEVEAGRLNWTWPEASEVNRVFGSEARRASVARLLAIVVGDHYGKRS
jgi:glycosyltransferase involved in cell wall biosynthesis